MACSTKSWPLMSTVPLVSGGMRRQDMLLLWTAALHVQADEQPLNCMSESQYNCIITYKLRILCLNHRPAARQLCSGMHYLTLCTGTCVQISVYGFQCCWACEVLHKKCHPAQCAVSVCVMPVMRTHRCIWWDGISNHVTYWSYTIIVLQTQFC